MKKKRAKIWHLSADHRLINQPTVAGVNVNAVLKMLKFKAMAFIYLTNGKKYPYNLK